MKTTINFNAAGVTFNKRQNLLAHLLSHPEAKITLWREPGNKHDPNAIKILANTGKRFQIGYVPRKLAETLAPIMDKKTFVAIDAFKVVGNWKSNYGIQLQASY